MQNPYLQVFFVRLLLKLPSTRESLTSLTTPVKDAALLDYGRTHNSEKREVTLKDSLLSHVAGMWLNSIPGIDHVQRGKEHPLPEREQREGRAFVSPVICNPSVLPLYPYPRHYTQKPLPPVPYFQ